MNLIVKKLAAMETAVDMLIISICRFETKSSTSRVFVKFQYSLLWGEATNYLNIRFFFNPEKYSYKIIRLRCENINYALI